MILYARTVFVGVFFGYLDGVQRATTTYGAPLYGNLITDTVRSVTVAHLWPHDFPISVKTAESVPVATLWRPQLVVVGVGHFGLLGLERQRWRDGARWFSQRWTCEPTTFDAIVAEMSQSKRTGEGLTPHRNQT